MGRFGVAVAPFGLGFSPFESKWSQDLKKHGFGVPGVTWGSNRGIFGFLGSLRSSLAMLALLGSYFWLILWFLVGIGLPWLHLMSRDRHSGAFRDAELLDTLPEANFHSKTCQK